MNRFQRITNIDTKKLDLSKRYTQNEHVMCKPAGLWYSINGEWVEWCTDNMDHWIRKYNITLEIDMSRVLVIKTIPELNAFEKKYSKSLYEDIEVIDWRRVTEDYTGIEIQNYHKLKWSERGLMRFHDTWFLGWDVSGGCIWDLSIVKYYTVLES